MNKITSITLHNGGEGMTARFTYSVIDGDGNITASMQQKNIVIIDPNALSSVNGLFEFIQGKI